MNDESDEDFQSVCWDEYHGKTSVIRIPPGRDLLPFIECYAFARNLSRTLPDCVLHSISTGRMMLVLHLGARGLESREPAGKRIIRNFVVGVAELDKGFKVRHLDQSDPYSAIYIRLTHAASHALFRKSPAAFTGRVVDLDGLCCDALCRLAEKMKPLGDPRFMASALDAYFKHEVDWGLARKGERILDVLKGLESPSRTLKVGELAASLGITYRTMGRTFKKFMGMTSIAYARLIRFNRACELMNGGRNLNFPSIAAAAGYFDQSHFIHDFTKVMGYPPQKLLLLCRNNLMAIGPVRFERVKSVYGDHIVSKQ